jgi:hypothetical protein
VRFVAWQLAVLSDLCKGGAAADGVVADAIVYVLSRL